MAEPTRPPVETAAYWQGRYDNGKTGWDRGSASEPFLTLHREGTLSSGRMIVPGCGNGWEVTAFAALGYDVTGIDFAVAPIAAIQARAAAEGVTVTVRQAD